ncbi:transcriptional regulator family: Fungal Specific TF [Agaricus bisporus var. burnettii]|uniref:Transcriptional regulator family: Fungal Specific TF n=1 Tax=Agaricus bisporus var. burnettii TaxID=192524 RepID=A0A8H7EZP0_AGABI|nr:transcriptional regulator family: Fungal Specific TF [Agaricus bisporus var. burnettii]
MSQDGSHFIADLIGDNPESEKHLEGFRISQITGPWYTKSPASYSIYVFLPEAMSSHYSDFPSNVRGGDLKMKHRRAAIRPNHAESPLNCAECRRSKLRCDRSIPCSSCVKRGCGAICPDGLLTTGQGNRFVVATTEELHEKNQQLSYRIRDLEEALQTLHSERSTVPHPLLSEALLRVKTPLQREPLPPRSSNTFILGDVTGPQGSMSVHDPRVSRYHGGTANSLYFLQHGQQRGTYASEEVFNNLQPFLPPEILTKASMMPISYCPISNKANLQCLLPHLPTRTISMELRSLFYTYASWMYNPIAEDIFEKHIFSIFFSSSASVQLPADPSTTHKLSLLFMTLAIGSLMDPSLSPYNMEAERYHQLARAALFQSSLSELATQYAVEALFLMSFYLFLVDRYGTTSEPRCLIMGIAVNIGQSIGLHRDSTHWSFEAAETRHRRQLFWEIFTYDSWQSLTFAVALLKISSTHGNTAVLRLDERIRSFPIPLILRLPESSNDNNSPVRPDMIGPTLQRYIVFAMREMSRLYLHRGFFTKAIVEHPENPLQSPYHDSIEAVFHCAQTFVERMWNLHSQAETICSRLWFLWAHMFSCSVILASIVIRCPSKDIAPAALVQLESASKLFSKVAPGFGAADLLETMQHLQRKAQHNLSEYRRVGTLRSHMAAPYPGPIVGGNNLDEVTLLRGSTFIGAKAEPIHPSSPQIPLSFLPSPQIFPLSVSGANIPPAPFNRYDAASRSGHRYDKATQTRLQPLQNAAYATNISTGTEYHDFCGIFQPIFPEKGNRTLDLPYFSMNQTLITPLLEESGKTSGASETRIQPVWMDLVADLD